MVLWNFVDVFSMILRISTILTDFQNFQRFCAWFWSHSNSNLLPNTFIFVDFYGSEQFSGQNPWNFGAWGKVISERDQKRSERKKLPVFCKVLPGRLGLSVTWTFGAKCYLNTITSAPGVKIMVFPSRRNIFLINCFTNCLVDARKYETLW